MTCNIKDSVLVICPALHHIDDIIHISIDMVEALVSVGGEGGPVAGIL